MLTETQRADTRQHAGSKGNGTRPDTRRPAPYDEHTEAQLLGLALFNRHARDVVTELRNDDFYEPRHKLVAAAIATIHLRTSDNQLDAYIVADHLRHDQLLDTVGGVPAIVALATDAASLGGGHADRYRDTLAELGRQRRALTILHSAVEAIHKGDDYTAGLAALDDIVTPGRTTTWDEIDLEPVVTAEIRAHPPCILHRDDGQALIYAGKVHAFNAESETAKSWLAMWACIEEIRDGNHVVYIDFEDSETGVVERLEALGADPALLYGPDRLFHYVRPDDPIDRVAIARLANLDATLVVLDGVTEAMSQNGWSIKENDDVALFLASLPRVFARAGAAVIQIDHVVKNKADRGDDAIGGIHKRAGIDGASYKLETLRPFGRGMAGAARITVTKDRPGHVRPNCVAGKTVGEVRLASIGDTVTLTVASPDSITNPDGGFRPTVLMERISRFVEDANVLDETPTSNTILAGVTGDKNAKRTALAKLTEEGYLTTATGRRNSHLHTSVKPYRDTADPASPHHKPTTDSDDPAEEEMF